MAATLEYVKGVYDDVFETYGDNRTKDWYMVSSPMPTLYLVAAYLIFVKIIGPKMMENRKPYELSTVMIVYNAIQTALALYLFIAGGIYGWFSRYNYVCEPYPDHATHPDDEVMLTLAYGFYLIRFLEFTDTVIFILRKKFNQVTVLHVVHHATVPVLFWLGLLVAPTGHYTFAAWLNAGVHFFMYSYYMLAAMGPKYKKYVWWKIYMTKIQLIQFAIVLLHTINSLVTDCKAPKIFGYIVIMQAVLFFTLFYNYYKNNFKKKISDSKSDKTTSSSMFLTEGILSPNFSKKFFEMCIPNQSVLYDDNEDNTTEHASTSSKLGVPKRKLRVHSD